MNLSFTKITMAALQSYALVWLKGQQQQTINV